MPSLYDSCIRNSLPVYPGAIQSKLSSAIPLFEKAWMNREGGGMNRGVDRPDQSGRQPGRESRLRNEKALRRRE